MDRKDKVRLAIESEEYVPMTRGELMEVLLVPEKDKEEFKSILSQLEDEGAIVKTKKRKYISTEKSGLIKAIYQGTGKGYGFAKTEGEDDLFIPPSSSQDAFDGDEILIRKTSAGKNGLSGEAEVVKILKRVHQRIVGTYKSEKFYAVVKSDNAKIGCDFLVTEEDSMGALNGQKVVIDIERYPTRERAAVGRVVEILGFPSDFGVDVLSVVRSYGFETEFPEEVMREAANLPDCVTDMSGRADLTDKIIFTIDGADTKDIDDAVSIEKIGNEWRLGVHIADVSHYVKPHSPLDEEALKRGTSVYLADRVIPMLPPKLSNGICSLNEGVLRYAVSVFMDIDRLGNVKSYTFSKSVIKSAFKMTYDTVYAIMTGTADAETMTKYEKTVPSIIEMRKLFKVLKEASKRRGNVDFDTPEAKLIIGDDGEVKDIVLRERNEAHMMIEEFMVIANSTVAEHMAKSKLPSIYRTHEAPDGEKLENFKSFLLTLGINPPTGELTPHKLEEFLESVKDRAEFPIISTMALRSMQKAKYLPENIGHYGLALEYYTHFTSPIRRYPDLLFHRSLKAAIDSDRKTLSYVKSVNKASAEISSERELSAERAERDVDDIKKAEYISHHVGENFEGVISSVTRFGFFVMLPNTIEGLVRIENMTGDSYEFDEKALTIRGRRKGEAYRLGDAITVTVIAANKELGQIDFMPEGMDYGEKERKASRTKQESVPRVFHRRKNRSGHRAVRNGGKKRSSRKGKS
jgi:ribonuclease R